jgi:hypothetical protein
VQQADAQLAALDLTVAWVTMSDADSGAISSAAGAAPVEPMSSADREPPRGDARIVYLGPVAPHWEVRSTFGDRQLIEDFRSRVQARLVLLPPHDPQFRRNRERVVRDAERENILLEWDLGYAEDDVVNVG